MKLGAPMKLQYWMDSDNLPRKRVQDHRDQTLTEFQNSAVHVPE